MPQIARQPIAQINHGVDGNIFREPARLGQARLKFQVFARQRTTEFAGHKNGIAGFCAGTQHGFSARNKTEQRNRN